MESMNEKKNKTGSTKKVVPFDIDEKLLDDEKIDRLIKESLIEEADKIEAELENDPALIGVGASEDMFQSIVARLKEQGDWEEEDVEENPKNIKEIKDAEDAENVKETKEAKEIKEIKEVKESEDTKEILEDQKSEQDKLEKLYQMLPEEDRHALELGKQVKKEKEIRRKKRKQRWKILKRGGVVAAVFLLVFGVSMTSEANRRLVLKVWDGLIYNLGFQLSTDYAGEKGTVQSKSKEEIDAIKSISGKMKIPVIEFEYMPKEMEFQRYEMMEDGFEAILFYEYKGKIFSITIINIEQEGTMYYALDNEAVLRENIIIDQGLEAKIWELNLDLEEETYVAEIGYKGCRYICNGMIPLEELEKILKSAYFL